MKITATKEDLLKTLKVASISVASAGDEMKSHYLFRLRDGKMEVLGNNERLLNGIHLDCEVDGASDVEEENRFTVEASRLMSWLSAVGKDKGKVSLRLSKGKVIAKATRGQVTFRSLDPDRFPFWDNRLKDAVPTGKMSAKRLHSILKHVQIFVSTNEAQDPEICSCEFQSGGRLYATDSAAATIIRVAGMEKSTARITSRKEINAVVKFLEAHIEDEIEFLEHPQCLYLKASSGNVIGQTRWKYDFPEIDLGEAYDDAEHWWTFDREEMLSAISFITPSAIRDRYRMSMRLDGVGNIVLSLQSAAGGTVEMPVTCKEIKSSDGATPLPQDGFPVSYAYMENVLKSLEGADVTLAACQLTDEGGALAGGYCSFKQERDGDVYLDVLGWYEEE